MSFLTRPIAWPPWKFGVLKFSMVAFGILMGSYFHEFWQQWHVALWAIFGITALVTTVWGFQTMFSLNPHGKQTAPP